MTFSEGHILKNIYWKTFTEGNLPKGYLLKDIYGRTFIDGHLPKDIYRRTFTEGHLPKDIVQSISSTQNQLELSWNIWDQAESPKTTQIFLNHHISTRKASNYLKPKLIEKSPWTLQLLTENKIMIFFIAKHFLDKLIRLPFKGTIEVFPT